MGITIIGLGYGDPNALTLQAHNELEKASDIFLRTLDHPAVTALPPHLRQSSFDRLYATLDDFEAINSAIADDILARGEHGTVLYAVPGHPLFGETSVQIILDRARGRNIPTRIIAGVSFVDAACAALKLDPLVAGLQVANAPDIAHQNFPHLDPDQPALIAQLDDRAVASQCKRTLLVLYPAAHCVTRIDGAGTSAEKLETLPLSDLDHAKYWGDTENSLPASQPLSEKSPERTFLMTTLFVPPLLRRSSLNALAEVVAHLRAPNGCAWDRAQTHRSLRKDFLEESYEVLETLDQNDMPHLREELGDLLLHIFLQAQIASESGEFRLSDVCADISEKLVRRHPHVFADVQVNSTAEIIENWDKIKRAENGGVKKKGGALPVLPALARAQKIVKRIHASADYADIAAQMKKLAHTRNRERDLGELLFALATYASSKHIDAESALRQVAGEKAKA
jgi:tetrapyrrole methylase family protein / MazG family protein